MQVCGERNRKSRRARSGALTLMVGIALACAPDGDSGSSSTESQLAGTWFGTLQRATGDVTTVAVTVDSESNITSVTYDITDCNDIGSNDTRTGAVTLGPKDRMYGFELTDGTTGGFYTDSAFRYATYVELVDEVAGLDFQIAALQKGAPCPLPSHTILDLTIKNATRPGSDAVTWDSKGEIAALQDRWNIHTECAEPTLVDPVTIPYASPPPARPPPVGDTDDKYDGPPYTGAFDIFDSRGIWTGQHDTPAEKFVAIMTADKGFAAAYLCNDVDRPACDFIIWLVRLRIPAPKPKCS